MMLSYWPLLETRVIVDAGWQVTYLWDEAPLEDVVSEYAWALCWLKWAAKFCLKILLLGFRGAISAASGVGQTPRQRVTIWLWDVSRTRPQSEGAVPRARS